MATHVWLAKQFVSGGSWPKAEVELKANSSASNPKRLRTDDFPLSHPARLQEFA